MKTILLSGAAAMLAATAAIAAPPAAPTTPSAPAAQGRMVTRAQVAQHVQAMFARVDANRDGIITQDEGAARPKGQTEGHEGHATKPEDHGQHMAKMFDRLDRDRNGVLSREEFNQHHAMGMEHGGMKMHRRMGRMGGIGGMRGRMFAMADLNRDNRVSLQEATSAALQRFDRADVNRDGQLTREERMQAHQQMREQMRGQPRG